MRNPPMDPIIQGESKALPFIVKSKLTGKPMDLSAASFLMWLRASKDDAAPILVKEDADFDKTLVASGRVSVWLTAEDTYQKAPWTYYGELRVTIVGSPVAIYKIPFELEIEATLTPNDWAVVPEGISSLEAFGTPVVALI